MGGWDTMKRGVDGLLEDQISVIDLLQISKEAFLEVYMLHFLIFRNASCFSWEKLTINT